MLFIKQNRTQFYEKRDEQLKNTVNSGIKNLKTMSDAKWADRRKHILLKKRMVMLEERERKYGKHYRICDDILQYMLEMVEVCGNKIGINSDNKASRATSKHQTEQKVAVPSVGVDSSRAKNPNFDKM
jgi:hypothetical protein